jgi:hemolysin D
LRQSTIKRETWSQSAVRLENKDAGFVRVGMPAEVKIEAFPFTRYGVIHAVATSISRDAVTESPAKQDDPSSPQPSDAEDNLHHLVHLRLDLTAINVDGSWVKLTPGMMITAEIKTGQRRVVDYVLSPLAKETSEAGHER